jgi:GDP-4-dehydro-6-deoxy-D-mannose reductase
MLITGVHGFIARHLTRCLEADGSADIHGTDVHVNAPVGFNPARYHRVDMNDLPRLGNTLGSVHPHAVFNLAGLTQGESPDIHRVNFMGAIHLLEAVRRWSPETRVLLVGSAAEYGHVPEHEMPIRETRPCSPMTPYGVSKYGMTLAAQGYWRDHRIRVAIARPFNIVGAGVPETLVVGAVLARIRRSMEEMGRPPAVVTVGRTDTERDFVAVEDVVECFCRLVRHDCWGEVFNICSGRTWLVRDILDCLGKNSPHPIEFRVDPTLVRGNDVKTVYGSCEKANRLLGFSPRVPIERALKAAWAAAMGQEAIT